MAATTKLIVWNAALREIGAAPLADTTSANKKQLTLNQAWDHAIEHVLALRDWGFARRRATLTGVADTAFPPYTYRMTKPSDYLRKCWIKTAADDEFQVDHAEIAAVFYALTTSALSEYVSDHADNYEPANWPPHFTRLLVLYMAAQVAPTLAGVGHEDVSVYEGRMQEALAKADEFEAIFLTNTAIAAERQPVMRRALEMMGQVLAGSVMVHAQADKLRWSMNRSWVHSVKYVLEQGAWNMATQRARLAEPLDAETVLPSASGGIVEGYSVAPAAAETAQDAAGFEYAFPLPDDFLHKVWIKSTPQSAYEITHQVMGEHIFCNELTAIMEYIAWSAFTQTPGNWSATFLETVAAYLALTVAPELVLEADGKGRARVMAPQIRDKLERNFLGKLSDAKLRDAIQQEPKTMPPGRFVQARAGSSATFGRRFQ